MIETQLELFCTRMSTVGQFGLEYRLLNFRVKWLVQPDIEYLLFISFGPGPGESVTKPSKIYRTNSCTSHGHFWPLVAYFKMRRVRLMHHRPKLHGTRTTYILFTRAIKLPSWYGKEYTRWLS